MALISWLSLLAVSFLCKARQVEILSVVQLHSLTTASGNISIFREPALQTPSDWLLVECYPRHRLQSQWRDRVHQIQKCVPGFSDEDARKLDLSQFFCPLERGNTATCQDKVQPPCKRDRDEADQDCKYDKVQCSGASDDRPGVISDISQIRNSDPLYFYTSGDLVDANPPQKPFINVNKMYSNGARILWAGQCPLAGEDEGKKMTGELLQPKEANVCKWLDFIKTKKIELLISISPNLDEVSQTQQGEKARCQDYIFLKKGIDFNSDAQTACAGKKFQVSQKESFAFSLPSSASSTGTEPASVFVREVEYDNYKFQQLYFDGFPDGAHQILEDPPYVVPQPQALSKILETAVGYNKIAVHCAAGKGRTGTVLLGIIARWHASDTAATLPVSELTEQLVKMRRRRPDMIESPYQLMALGRALHLSDVKACPMEEQNKQYAVVPVQSSSGSAERSSQSPPSKGVAVAPLRTNGGTSDHLSQDKPSESIAARAVLIYFFRVYVVLHVMYS